MCSLAGVYWFGNNCPGSKSLTGMAESALTCLKSRGPDESSVVRVRGNLVMGGNRLIIRGSPGEGSMPFKHGQNLMFYNGEIYNFRDWKKDTSSDGEVILPLYDEFGQKAFSKLDGEFAISIWDESKESLLLIRDPFGTKPVYFSLDNSRLLWASSASAINEMERHDFCAAIQGPCYKHTLSVQEPYTSYKGIWLLPPGHFLLGNDSGVKLCCYNRWDEYSADGEDVTKLFESLEKSLESRLDYTATVGIPMSAGIDSAALADTVYKSPSSRHSGKIEVIIKYTELTRAAGLLPSMGFSADSMTIINHSNSHIDWERLILQSKEHRLILPVRDALKYLSDKLDARIPEDVLKTIKNLPTTRIERIEYKYKTQNYLQKPLGYMPIIWFDYSRLSCNSGFPLKLIVEYMRSYWGAQRLWQLPFYAISMVIRRIKAIIDYYRKPSIGITP